MLCCRTIEFSPFHPFTRFEQSRVCDFCIEFEINPCLLSVEQWTIFFMNFDIRLSQDGPLFVLRGHGLYFPTFLKSDFVTANSVDPDEFCIQCVHGFPA